MSPDMCVHHDTPALIDLDGGDVMILNDQTFLISRNERESGVGMDDDQNQNLLWSRIALNEEKGVNLHSRRRSL